MASPPAAEMNWLQFIAAMTGSLAWPIAAVAIALLFRSQIAALLRKVQRLTWGDKSVDFSEKLDKVESLAREVTTEQPQLMQPRTLPGERFQKLLEISPSAAILEAWAPLEQTMREIGEARSYKPDTLRSPYETYKRLLAEEQISPNVYKMLRDLHGIRNDAVHQRDVSPTDALRFYDLAEEVMRALKKPENS